MLMDLFHDNLAIAAKRRVHFHEFMLDVHARLHEERKKESGDPILPVAAALAATARVLAFDEMVVNNSADAMIMSRLFTALIERHGVVIVTTSNRAPSQLYLNGSTCWASTARPITAWTACRAWAPGTPRSATRQPLRCARRFSA
jgi:cell division protein ZapE